MQHQRFPSLQHDPGNYFTAGAEASELRGQSEQEYDERGQVWRSRVYEVNPANGQVGDRLTSTHWYNPRGMLIKCRDANGLFHKNQLDGAGRPVAGFIGFDAADDAMAAGLAKYQSAAIQP